MLNAPRPDSMVIWGNVLTFCNRGVVASAACRVLLGDCYGRSEESWGVLCGYWVASPAHAQAAMADARLRRGAWTIGDEPRLQEGARAPSGREHQGQRLGRAACGGRAGAASCWRG